MEEELLDAKQVAKKLHISYRNALLKAETGELPAFKIGDLWRFRPSDIEIYIQKSIAMQQKKVEDGRG